MSSQDEIGELGFDQAQFEALETDFENVRPPSHHFSLGFQAQSGLIRRFAPVSQLLLELVVG